MDGFYRSHDLGIQWLILKFLDFFRRACGLVEYHTVTRRRCKKSGFHFRYRYFLVFGGRDIQPVNTLEGQLFVDFSKVGFLCQHRYGYLFFPGIFNSGPLLTSLGAASLSSCRTLDIEHREHAVAVPLERPVQSGECHHQ